MSTRRANSSRLLVVALLGVLVATTASCDEDAMDFDLPGFDPEPTAPALEPTTTTSGAAAAPALGTRDADESPAPGGGLELVPRIVEQVTPSTVAVSVFSGGRPAGQGSGVIWSEDGYIITNNHVVEVGDEISVVLANGQTHPAELVGRDPATDIAVLAVDVQGLPAARFAEELPRVGELAVAIGNPFGFQGTVTAGIISGVERDLPVRETSLVGLIQTDAPISPGNSGGALVDAGGTVVGINVAAIPPQTGATSIGFAIPAPLATDVAASLVETGTVEHPFLGISGLPVTPAVAAEFGLDRAGVLVAQLTPGGPAETGGIEVGDVIVAIAGEEVRDLGDLLVRLRRHDPGDTVTVTVVRDGRAGDVDVTLGTLPTG